MKFAIRSCFRNWVMAHGNFNVHTAGGRDMQVHREFGQRNEVTWPSQWSKALKDGEVAGRNKSRVRCM